MTRRSRGTEISGDTTRARAAHVLDRILRGGAYSNVVVRSETSDLDERDRRFVQHLVFETLRHLRRIDAMLEEVSSRPLDRLDPHVLAVLRIATEEIVFAGTPPHAAVDGAVTAARSLAGERSTGFVNGVLRTVATASLPEGSGDVDDLAPWIVETLTKQWGGDDAAAFAAAVNREPRIGVRRRVQGPELGTAVDGISGSELVSDPSIVARSVASGAAVVVDPASVAVGNAVEVEPGMAVLDLAAAPGGKTWHLWDAMAGDGLLVAADRHPRRLQSARRRLPDGIEWVRADALAPPFRPDTFDRVLLDAPCTGLGTLRRRPEIRHRLRPTSPSEMGRLQRRLLERALPLVRRGGRLVYSVCTVFDAETVDVVAGLGSRAPDGIPGRSLSGGVLLAPHVTDTDGMFIAVFDR